MTRPLSHSLDSRTELLRRARSFYIILSGRVGIFINTDLSAGGPGGDMRSSPNDEAPNRAALGNYIKSLGALAHTPHSFSRSRPCPQVYYTRTSAVTHIRHLHSAVLLLFTVFVAEAEAILLDHLCVSLRGLVTWACVLITCASSVIYEWHNT